MSPHTMSTLAGLVGGTLVGPARSFSNLLTDSRQLNREPGTRSQEHTAAAATDGYHNGEGEATLFFALKGPKHNGHQYVDELYARGVRCFCVEKGFNVAPYPEASFVLCAAPLAALQQLAKEQRLASQARICAICGSNGKTIVKEWLASLIAEDLNLVRSPRSYNSQVGVPLSLLNLGPATQLALIEAGISEPGEMATLEDIIQPEDVIFTHLGAAHDEGFDSRKQKLQEKLLLSRGAKRIVYPANELEGENTELGSIADYLPEGVERVGFSWMRDALASTVAVSINGTPLLTLTTSFSDAASLSNLSAAAVYAHLAGLDNDTIAQRAAELRPLDMRLRQLEAVNGCTLLDDSYSADLGSLEVALTQLSLLGSRLGLSKTLIVSDLHTAAGPTLDAKAVLQLAIAKGVKRIIGVGDGFVQAQGTVLQEHNDADSTPIIETFPTTEVFLQQRSTGDFHNEAILVKGQRRYGFERIVTRLSKLRNRTCMEVNLNALAGNIAYFRSYLRPTTKMLCMVKAYSYGTGSFEIARLMEREGVDYLGVAFADEGRELREAGIRLPIMVMNPEPHSYDLMLQECLEPQLYGWRELEEYSSAAASAGMTGVAVHVKFNTGMTRSGFETWEATAVGDRLRTLGNLRVVSAFSHLVESEDPSCDTGTREQIERFEQACRDLTEALGQPVIRHILNSAGIERFDDAQMEMVRLGIGLYGVSAIGSPLVHNVCTLRSYVSLLRPVKAGETVGYNRRTRLTRDSLIAVVPIGYADGLDRRLSNGIGHVLIRGQWAPIAGNVCMDICMVDVTDIAGVAEGDDVELFGDREPVWEMAKRCGTICYELLTGISRRVPRVYTVE